MTGEEAFRLGFLARLLEAGATPAEVQKIVKSANGPLDWLASLTGSATGLGLGALAAAPPLAGYAGGWAAAKAQETDTDTEDFKKRELIAEYQRLAQRARLMRKGRLLREKLRNA